MNKKTLNTLLAGAVAVAALGAADTARAMEAKAKEGQEKCYGVVKAGMNGCGAADKSHGCATMAKEDASGVDWISLPTGTCEKLTGGSLTPILGDEPKAEDESSESENHEDHEDEHEDDGHKDGEHE